MVKDDFRWYMMFKAEIGKAMHNMNIVKLIKTVASPLEKYT